MFACEVCGAVAIEPSGNDCQSLPLCIAQCACTCLTDCSLAAVTLQEEYETVRVGCVLGLYGGFRHTKTSAFVLECFLLRQKQNLHGQFEFVTQCVTKLLAAGRLAFAAAPEQGVHATQPSRLAQRHVSTAPTRTECRSVLASGSKFHA